MPRCGWCKKGWHVNRALLFVFDVLEDSRTVSVILVDFLPLTVLFWRQRRQVGIVLALEQSARAECACWSQTVRWAAASSSSQRMPWRAPVAPPCVAVWRHGEVLLRAPDWNEPDGRAAFDVLMEKDRDRKYLWRWNFRDHYALSRCTILSAPRIAHIGQAVSVSQLGGGTILLGNTSAQVCLSASMKVMTVS